MRQKQNWTVSNTEEISDGELAELFVLASFDKDRLKMLIDRVFVYGVDAIEIVWRVGNPYNAEIIVLKPVSICGKYGRMRQRFLQENHRGIYSYMLLSETLWKHLAEIDEEINEILDRLVGQMAKKEGVTEQPKSDDWLCWLQKMNSIRSRAEEIVLHDLIYSL